MAIVKENGLQQIIEIDGKKEDKEAEQNKFEFGKSGLASYVKDIFESFKTARRPFEDIWEECWQNFLGQYQLNTVWKRKTEGKKNRSKIFIKLTSLKCNTAHSKIADVLFTGRNVMPFDVEALEPEVFGIPAEVAKEASEAMKKRLKEHFKKIRLKKMMDVGILEMAIFGTAILKGPIITTKRVPQVRTRNIAGLPANQIDPDINPFEVAHVNEVVPLIDRVPIWEYYTDTNASSTQDAIGEIHFTRILPAQFRRFAYQGGYNSEEVFEAARRAAASDKDDTKYIQLGDNYMGVQGEKDKRVSVCEYWGLVPVQMLKDAGVECPADVDDEDSIEALVVLAADGIVIKACVNPLGRRPFYVCPYKERPGQIYGAGVAEAMRDSQKMINSAARLLIDNKALSGNGMVAINIDRINTKRTKDLEVYPGKTWYIKGNFAPREAVDAVQFPDVTMGLRELIEMFERFADEETGLPRYTAGEQSTWMNKMLDIITPVPMADGTYKKLGDIVDGDRIIGSDGKSIRVVKAHPIQNPKKAYEIKFRSGDVIVAGGEHLWTINTKETKWITINTDSLYARYKKNKAVIYIPRTQRPEFSGGKELPLDPYILGLWLGNGHTNGARITMPDDAGIMKYIKKWLEDTGGKIITDSYQNSGLAKTYTISGIESCRNKEGQFASNKSLHSVLKGLGLLKKYKKDSQKKIPETYFYASYENRLALLRGLMDTDGCHHSGSLGIFTQKEGQLLDDIVRLIVSLGGFPKVHEVYPNNDWVKEGARYYQVTFSLIDNPFGPSKKAKKWRPSPKSIHVRQRIVSMTEVDIRPMRCLTVDAEDGLYAVGDRFTLTHNTASGMSMLMTAANINLKTVIENIDDYWIEPIVEAFGDFLNTVMGAGQGVPLKFKATGADSMVAKEIKMENYMKFLQITATPQDAIFMDRIKLMKAIARLLETEDVMRTDEEIKQIMAEMGQRSSQPSDLRSRLNIEKLYPLLTRMEQVQILKDIGIEPDINNIQSLPPGSGGSIPSPLPTFPEGQG